MTVMGEVLVKELSDAGSIPARSICNREHTLVCSLLQIKIEGQVHQTHKGAEGFFQADKHQHLSGGFLKRFLTIFFNS